MPNHKKNEKSGTDFLCPIDFLKRLCYNKENEHKGVFPMEKIIHIEGMSCAHCSRRVENALNELDGVTATVHLETKSATLHCTKEVSMDAIKEAVEDAGFTLAE